MSRIESSDIHTFGNKDLFLLRRCVCIYTVYKDGNKDGFIIVTMMSSGASECLRLCSDLPG